MYEERYIYRDAVSLPWSMDIVIGISYKITHNIINVTVILLLDM